MESAVLCIQILSKKCDRLLFRRKLDEWSWQAAEQLIFQSEKHIKICLFAFIQVLLMSPLKKVKTISGKEFLLKWTYPRLSNINSFWKLTTVLKHFVIRYEANDFQTAEHCGTHLDAPVHFGRTKWSVDQIPPERFIGPGLFWNFQH